MPTETQDVGMYISAIFTSTPEEFEALYGAFDAVMTKYSRLIERCQFFGISSNRRGKDRIQDCTFHVLS